ncbi:MAG: PIN domain nuclease [Desulfurococcales archaeon]|nr:PIN domain nuclease [Desulfurococcales archaeon]MCE4621905.1 PIN domain nuclease [Desulfurococcales archaeon]MCE4628859.1 PIN domain nuclease [Desulfurococcales archaeon]
MVKESRIIVDTYAIIADLTGQASESAVKILDDIRLARIEGILHYLIVYELAYHWRRGRLPFHSEEELREFIDTYFVVQPLNPAIAVEASRLKIVGDELLRNSRNPRLNRRRLSVSDVTSIVLAQMLKAPILTGDIDLAYVAQKIGIKIIW